MGFLMVSNRRGFSHNAGVLERGVCCQSQRPI